MADWAGTLSATLVASSLQVLVAGVVAYAVVRVGRVSGPPAYSIYGIVLVIALLAPVSSTFRAQLGQLRARVTSADLLQKLRPEPAFPPSQIPVALQRWHRVQARAHARNGSQETTESRQVQVPAGQTAVAATESIAATEPVPNRFRWLDYAHWGRFVALLWLAGFSIALLRVLSGGYGSARSWRPSHLSTRRSFCACWIVVPSRLDCAERRVLCRQKICVRQVFWAFGGPRSSSRNSIWKRPRPVNSVSLCCMSSPTCGEATLGGCRSRSRRALSFSFTPSFIGPVDRWSCSGKSFATVLSSTPQKTVLSMRIFFWNKPGRPLRRGSDRQLLSWETEPVR